MSIFDELLSIGKQQPPSGPVPATPDEAAHPPKRENLPGAPIVGWTAPKTPPLAPPLDDLKLAIGDQLAKLYEPMARMAAVVEALTELQREQAARDVDIEDVLPLTTQPSKVNVHGRRYNAILFGGTGTQDVNITRPGLPTYKKTLAVGWNILNVPDSSQIALASGASTVNVLFICSHHFLGNPL